MQARLSRARLIHPEIPFPQMVVSRVIPGLPELKLGDPYPNPGADKRARLRAALYVEQRRLKPAPPPPEQHAAPAAKEKPKPWVTKSPSAR